PNDEIIAQTLTRASSAPATIQMLGAFVQDGTPVARAGFYDPASGGSKQTELFTINNGSNQTVQPSINRYTRFSPVGTFGLYVNFPTYGRSSFSQDSLNTWDTGNANGRMLRFYPLRDSDGSIVANAYVVGVESISSYSDQQDALFVIRNVKPA